MTTSAAKEAFRNDATFTSALGRDYCALASDRSTAGDLSDADYSGRKSLRRSTSTISIGANTGRNTPIRPDMVVSQCRC
jgi:hypothetical protein